MATFISLHYFATGPGQELYQYLCEKGIDAALWEIPFSFSTVTIETLVCITDYCYIVLNAREGRLL